MSKHAWHGDAGGDSLARAIHESVGLADHDPKWVAAFDVERERLMRLLPGAFVDIAHIGSSPVEGLRSKPVVDLLAGVRSMHEAFALDGPLCANGYTSSADFNGSLTDRQFFMRHAAGRRTHHLHVVVHDSQAWHDRIDFARLLRTDADLRRRYAALKEHLATLHAEERETYTEGKSAFIRAALRGDPTRTHR